MGRAAKLAALKLRVSRAGRPMSKLPGSDKLPTRLGNLPGSSSFQKPPEALGGGKPCKAPGRLINQEPHEKRCKAPYKVTPSAKPTFREVRGHKIHRNIRCLHSECHGNHPSSVPGTATGLLSSQWLFYQRKAARAVSVPEAASSFPGTARALLVLSQLPKLPGASWASRSSGATPHAPSYETGQA